MPIWPYPPGHPVYPNQPNVAWPTQPNPRMDRHGWTQFIASQTIPTFVPEYNKHEQYNPYVDNRHISNPSNQHDPLSQQASYNDCQVFCVDRVGLEHNKPPVFTQRYKVALPDNEEQSCLNSPSTNSRKSSCFNCLETDHMISDCPHPRDQDRIRRNMQTFRESNQSAAGSGQDRYHGASTDRRMLKGGVSAARRLGKYNHMLPGECSKDLKAALGINDQQLPAYVYRMRELGYPPGWLQECLVYRSINEGAKEEYDFDRLISFSGFNKIPPECILDESELYGVPEYNEEMFGKDSFVQSLLNSGCIAIGADSNETGDRGDPMELDEEETPDRLNSRIDVVDEVQDTNVLSDNQSGSINDEAVVDLSKLSDWTESFLSRDNIGDTLEESEGTPVALETERINFIMPTVDKFADGINEHRFFENLPGVVGNFARIMESVKGVRSDNV